MVFFESKNLLEKKIRNHEKIYTFFYKVTAKKWNAEEYGNGFDLQGFHLRCQLFREPLQSTPKPNQDGATLLVRNHAQ